MEDLELTLLNRFYETFDQASIVLTYKGTFSQKGLIDVGTTLRTNLKADDVVLQVIKKMFSIFIEEAQNIMKYSARRSDTNNGEKAGEGMITILKKRDCFYIISGNIIRKKDQKDLEKKLKHINSLDAESLKEYYKDKKYGAEKLSGKSSAGLGFFDMSLKAEKPLEWSFSHVDDQHSFFSLKIAIKQP